MGPFRCLAACIGLCAGTAGATQLYATDFEGFTAGDDHWVGTEGWIGSSVGLGVHGIDSNALPALGKTAFIGYARPASTFVTVLRPFRFDAVATNRPLIDFESLMGIQDSTNGYRDSFFFSFYNTNGSFLASIRFSNEDLSFGIWRLDGHAQFDTGRDFVRNELHLLHARMDFAANRWSADLDGIDLFTNAVFTGTTNPLTLGFTAAEWQLASTNLNNHGDNWMLLADWSVAASPKGEEPFLCRALSADAEGRPLVTWKGDVGFDYAVESAGADGQWRTNAPLATVTDNRSTGTLSFADTPAAGATARLYRVTRRESPL